MERKGSIVIFCERSQPDTLEEELSMLHGREQDPVPKACWIEMLGIDFREFHVLVAFFPPMMATQLATVPETLLPTYNRLNCEERALLDARLGLMPGRSIGPWNAFSASRDLDNKPRSKRKLRGTSSALDVNSRVQGSRKAA